MLRPTEEYLYQTALAHFQTSLYSDKISLHDIPKEIRTAETTIYVIAFRISRGSRERYFSDLAVLRDDILSLKDGYFNKTHLIETLSSYLSKMYVSNTITEESLNEFEQNLPKSLLQGLQRRSGITRTNIKVALAEQRAVNGE